MMQLSGGNNTDIGFLIGQAIGQGLGQLAQNREARGFVKDLENQYNDDEINKTKGLLNNLNLMQSSGFGSEGANKAFLNMQNMGYNGPAITQENFGDIQSKLQERQDYFNTWGGINQGKRLHDPNYMKWDNFKLNAPMGFL